MLDLPATFHALPAAKYEVLEAIRLSLKFDLPGDYPEFMSAYDGGEGFIDEHYLILWQAKDLKAFSDDYQFDEYAPSLVPFGSNGGGEAFAFDMRTVPPAIVIVPFIGLTDATRVALSFDAFLTRLRDDPRSFWEGGATPT
jgi:hypothetical protein